MAGKLSVLSLGFGWGRDRAEPTAGKFSVLSGGPPSVLVLRGLPGSLSAAGLLPQVLAARGLPGWSAADPPLACVTLAPAGGTARKESVISQGGTPVFGRVLPVSDFAASGFAVSGCAVLGCAVLGFASPGLAVGGSAAPVPGWPPFAGPGPFA
jgi:hypothetical protein